VVLLFLDGTKIGVLKRYFKCAPVSIPAASHPGGIEAAINPILVALGLRLPSAVKAPAPVASGAVEELVLPLSDFAITEYEGKRRATARASLIYHPAGQRQQPVQSSQAWRMQGPLGPIEADELRWYLKKYAIWPSSVFATRKLAVARKLQH
jgi:hypothetical protein